MRHVPTALFIDTEVFKRNALRLDTREFALLKTTFVKGGIRLLLPAMMERELMRHYERQAAHCGALWAELLKQHPIKLLKSWQPRAAEEVSAECLIVFKDEWDQFKNHFTVELLPLVGDLDNVVDQYFGIKAAILRKETKRIS
jgi:PIN domain